MSSQLRVKEGGLESGLMEFGEVEFGEDEFGEDEFGEDMAAGDRFKVGFPNSERDVERDVGRRVDLFQVRWSSWD